MNWNIEELGATKRKMTVEVPAEKARGQYETALKDIQKQARIKGFRPGKVPITMIKRMFGSQIEQDVAQKLIEESLPEAIKDVSDIMVSQPTLEDSQFAEGEPFRFTVTFEVRPEFEIAGYEGLTLEKEALKVTDEMVDNKLEELRRAYATTKSVEEERPVREGDLAVIDYTSYEGDQPIEGGANPNYQLEVGAGRFHKIFESELVGMNKGEEKEITVSFPDNHYNPKLSGKDIRYQAKLIDIKEKVLPTLDDEFAKDLGQETETLEALQNRIREDLTRGEENRIQGELEKQVGEKLSDLVEFELPENLVAQELDGMIQNTAFNLKRSGLSMEAMGLDENKMREEMRPQAEKRVKVALILDRISKEKEIEVEEEDENDSLMRIARDMQQPPESIREIYNKNNWMAQLREGILAEKTLKFVIDSANIVETEMAKDAEAEKTE